MAARGQHKEALAALARAGATPKSARELARAKPDREEPWYVFIGRPPRLRPDAHPVEAAPTRLQRQWEARALTTGGESGPALTPESAKAALEQYMKTGFAHEHPALARSPAR
jgi:hypothetical protein